MERYERYFSEAFPHPEDRRAFLHHRIKSAPISAANFRLAHLLGSGRIANLVVTTNFDELLARALRLFGRDAIICDHPKTTERIDPQRPDIQIIHAHGTHWFYDCCNLKDEIENRARRERDDNSSMGQLLDRILFDKSPLVVGYSGWDGDVIMSALKRRLKLPLRYNLYWFCYGRSDISALPEWLREHANVRLVVPSEPQELLSRSEGVRASEDSSNSALASSPAGVSSRDMQSRDSLLPASQVFDAFVRKLSLAEPELTREPLEFFASQLRRNLVSPDLIGDGDVYLIKRVIRQVEEGAELSKAEMAKRSQRQKETASLLGRVAETTRLAEYANAVEVAGKIDLSVLNDSQRSDLEEALEAIYLNAAGSDIGLAASRIRKDLCALARKNSSDSSFWLEREARALHGIAYCLGELKQPNEAVTTYGHVDASFGDRPEPGVRLIVATSLVNKGVVLSRLGRAEEALTTYEQVVARYGQDADDYAAEPVVDAICNTGDALWDLERPEEAIKAYSEAIRRFLTKDDVAVKRTVARAMVNKTSLLMLAGLDADASDVCGTLIAKFGEDADVEIAHCVARAYVHKMSVRMRANDNDGAISVADDLVSRLGNSVTPEVQRLVAKSLMSKASLLIAAGKASDAIGVYDDVIHRFASVTDSQVRALALRARTLRDNAIVHSKKGAAARRKEQAGQAVTRAGQRKHGD